MPGQQTEQGIMELIYNKINEIIGAGNQLFCMQFPAQPLNYRMYQYDTEGNDSMLTKPYTVAESEFRLSDQLFDVSPITAGPNGERLSVVYDILINNFIPKLDYLVPFIRDRAGFAHFLLEPSDEKKNGKNLSRIELCKQLYEEYLVARNQWNKDKSNKYDELKKEENGLDEYARWLSSEGLVREEQLNNLYNDVVVRGHLHEVLTLLGYLNSKSIAEELELCKQRMRNSARLSLDESMTVYPVQFQPNNWFKALTPNLNPQDLTMAQDSIRDHFLAKKRELSRAEAELKQMELMTVNPDDIERLTTQVNGAKGQLDEAERALVNEYGQGIVGAAKIYLTAIDPLAVASIKANNAYAIASNDSTLKAVGLDEDVDPNDTSPTSYLGMLTDAVKGIAGTYDRQQELNKALSNLTDLKAQKAQLESKDWKFNKLNLEQRIKELQAEVDYYGTLVAQVQQKTASSNPTVTATATAIVDTTTGVVTGFTVTGQGSGYKLPPIVRISGGNGKGATAEAVLTGDKVTIINVTNGGSGYQAAPNVVLTGGGDQPSSTTLSAPQTQAEAELNGMFQDILISTSATVQASAQGNSARSDVNQWNVSGWFFSAGGQSNSSTATSSQRSQFFNQEMEIGFRVAKVSFDRGGWFSPEIFKLSNAFYRLYEDTKVAPGLTIKKIQDKVNQTSNPGEDPLQNLTSWDKLGKTPATNKKIPYALPAFPTAMVIAKDITIKVKQQSQTSNSEKSVVEEATSSSGGFLCFSASSASSSKSASESTFHGSQAGYYYIRIPGPQVLGYYLQFVPEDNSDIFKQNIDQNGDSAVLKAFQLYNQAPNLVNTPLANPRIAPSEDGPD